MRNLYLRLKLRVRQLARTIGAWLLEAASSPRSTWYLIRTRTGRRHRANVARLDLVVEEKQSFVQVTDFWGGRSLYRSDELLELRPCASPARGPVKTLEVMHL